jgi:hypothetical protein
MLSAIVMLMPPVLLLPSAAIPKTFFETVTRLRATCALPPGWGLTLIPAPPPPLPLVVNTLSLTISFAGPVGLKSTPPTVPFVTKTRSRMRVPEPKNSIPLGRC